MTKHLAYIFRRKDDALRTNKALRDHSILTHMDGSRGAWRLVVIVPQTMPEDDALNLVTNVMNGVA